MSTGRVTPPSSTRSHHWWMPVVFVTALVVAFFAFDLDRFASLDALKARQAAVETYRQAHPWQAAAIFFSWAARRPTFREPVFL